ncbi:PadR family transcriptional regulator [Sulfodiicoccus acidiphilus]|uniref:PadR family transcriptional regulator n=1 Tax=Sulfodiicoccus acidiphilus TaxID=1670455 RepID=A0A348B2D5_9CREN|nr:PadR family transcriptional regulator [Sulfodiicoccus acidiphilus]BBD72337.1 PadR family transcriptional regulator [Sulfodiicoccus acidiphilus]GGT90183.1 PadR family transcriptional regulator [Sulfodiicoccus acidiphilus]
MKRLNAARVRKGLLRYLILDALAMKPMYGYEIIKYVEFKSRGLYSPSPGSIYPILRKLREEELAEESEEDGKKVYRITQKGLKVRETAKMELGEAFTEARAFRTVIAKLFEMAVFLYISKEKLDGTRTAQVIDVLDNCDKNLREILK